ncbi:MAG: hypothetical protein LBM08_00860 [Dysgonamonadaceae bacterium]|jgi:hypothetical protein|nr:hypothetical protein [Dysgonamonadaceae bacterium]
MSNLKKTETRQVLVFNAHKRLTGIYSSSYEAAKALGIHTQSVHYACSGKCISAKNRYMRQAQKNVRIYMEDLGVLCLEEYDKLCEVERKLYPDAQMSRRGMKYNKSTKETQV